MPAGVERQDGKDYLILCIVQARDFPIARFSDQSPTFAKFEAGASIDPFPWRLKAACSSVIRPAFPIFVVLIPEAPLTAKIND